MSSAAATIPALDPADGCPTDARRYARFLAVSRPGSCGWPRSQPPAAPATAVNNSWPPARRQFDALPIRKPPHLREAHAFFARHQ
jgi:hypothetical protein